MQIESVLTPEETKALSRLVSTPDAKQAIEAKFQVVSLQKMIEAGGRVRVGLDRAHSDPRRLMLDSFDEIYGRAPRAASFLLPKLAIAPSRARNVQFRAIGNVLSYSTGKWEMDVKSPWRSGGTESFTALAPIIPAEAQAVVEQYKFSLVLWEADWQPVPVPLGDPAILIPLIGDLYAVGAVWDLTELEKKVLQKAFV